MDSERAQEPSGKRQPPPPKIITALNTDGGEPDRTVMLQLKSSEEQIVWKSFFELLGFRVLIPRDPIDSFTIADKARGSKFFVLADQYVSVTLGDYWQTRLNANIFILASEYDATREDIFNVTGAVAIFVRSKTGNPIECDVLFDA